MVLSEKVAFILKGQIVNVFSRDWINSGVVWLAVSIFDNQDRFESSKGFSLTCMREREMENTEWI